MRGIDIGKNSQELRYQSIKFVLILVIIYRTHIIPEGHIVKIILIEVNGFLLVGLDHISIQVEIPVLYRFFLRTDRGIQLIIFTAVIALSVSLGYVFFF